MVFTDIILFYLDYRNTIVKKTVHVHEV